MADQTTIAELDQGHPAPEPATTPDTQSAVETPQPASSGEGVSQEMEAVATPPKADEAASPTSHRDKLIAKLTGVEDVPSTDEAEPEEAEPKAAETPAPTPKEEDKPKAVEPTSKEDEDRTELTNETAKAMKPGEVRRKINRLLTETRELRPMAQGFKEIIDYCTENDFTPEDYKAWVALGAGINKGDEGALKRFQDLAAKVLPPAPAAGGLTPELDSWLIDQTRDLEISKATAAELRKRLGAAPAAATPAAPAAAPKPAAPAAPPTPRADPIIVARQRATEEIGKATDEYEKRIGVANYKALEPRIMAELAKRKGRHPDAWPDIFRSVVETELARAPKPAQIGGTLRPGTSSAPASQPVFKSERERVIASYT
jgi:hypothetical protein